MKHQKSIFITGAASGIGKATALEFAKRGWFTGLFDVNGEGLAELASVIGEDNCCHKILDVTDPQSYEEAVSFFGSHTDEKMTVLFNCAGIMRMGSLDDVPLEEQLKTIRINFDGVVIGIYASLPLLKKTEVAAVVSMSSASALYGVPDLAVYSATKFAVRGLTEALSIELEKQGITVTDLMPLYVNTNMIVTQQHKSGTLNTFGAKLTPEEIAKLVWRAVHNRKVHWLPGIKLKTLQAFGRLMPFIERPVMKLANKN